MMLGKLNLADHFTHNNSAGKRYLNGS